MTASVDEFTTIVSRLSRLSVERHFDAYADVDWDGPELAVDPADPRLEILAGDPLAATEWYQTQTPEARARLGHYRWAACMKTGWHFENLLQRGLLSYAMRLPNGSPEFRYLHHETIEESQHTLMFQEFVNRSGLPVRGMPRFLRRQVELFVVPMARLFPSLFFLFVLAGEDPIDHVQRRALKNSTALHPLVERIMRIHVTEEARHLSFARHYLKRTVPTLGWLRRRILTMAGPVVLGIAARRMLLLPGDLRRECGVPRKVARDAFHTLQGRRLLAESVGKTRELWMELGLVTGPSKLLWRAAGLWSVPEVPGAPGVPDVPEETRSA